METPSADAANLPEASDLPPASTPYRIWLSIRNRILGGVVLVLPFLITLWVLTWLYSLLERFVIEPLARFVLWKVLRNNPEVELPDWFKFYAAPAIGLLIVLFLLYLLGFFLHSRLHQIMDWVLLRVPGVSVVYNGVQKIFQTLTKQGSQQKRPQRVVLVAFPHPGMRVPAFVTGSCRDIQTQKSILCVYVPTTPVPTSGYMLLVPEDEVIELTWSSEEALQAIISGGLTAPPEVGYYKPMQGGSPVVPSS